MTECVILFRNIATGKVAFISDDDEIKVFDNIDDACAMTMDHPLLRAFPFQIVELDEL